MIEQQNQVMKARMIHTRDNNQKIVMSIKICFDSAVSEQAVIQARFQLFNYYHFWESMQEKLFKTYQEMSKQDRRRVHSNFLAGQRFSQRDKGTKDVIRLWLKDLNEHVEILDQLALEEEELGHDKLGLRIKRARNLQRVLESWRQAKEERLEKARIAALEAESVFTKLKRSVLAFFSRNPEKNTSKEQQYNLIKKHQDY